MIFQIIFLSTLIVIITRQPMTSRQFIIFSASLFLLITISDMIGTICACVIRDKVNAIMFALAYIGTIMLFGGYFLSDATIPTFLKYFPQLSHARHSFELIMLSVYGMGRCTSKRSLIKHDIDLDDIITSRPIELFSKAIKGLNIRPDVSKVVSPYLGLKDDVCLAQVINSTRAYLGITEDSDDSDVTNVKDAINSASDILSDDADEYFDNEIDNYEKMIDSSSDSLPLLIFDFDNHHLNNCLISLFVLLIVYKLIAIITFRSAVK